MKRQTVEVTGRSGTLELDGIGFRTADHYTRLMPVSDSTNRWFRLAMLPVRAVALVVLWSTSTPPRLVITVIVVTAAVALGR